MCANYHFFCCELNYQYKIFKNDLNLAIFAQIIWISRVLKLGIKKSNELQFEIEVVDMNKILRQIKKKYYIIVKKLRGVIFKEVFTKIVED